MDLPPVRFEMLRLNLNPRPAAPACIPVPGPDAQALSFSMAEAPPCRDPAARLAIDEPPGWPPARSAGGDSWTLPPPPVPPRPAS
ncbi:MULTISPECIES: hypothetical protein [unclassified Synechococcus]|uniref:hypothetical protein n=1 Tax=unclassified Synechococcus TaxID=2626047 RepID=UPI000069854A|nr:MULTISPECIES: hypothetical protein [unclassified Synechococcus]EAQ75375.1 hypothetical protein WH5701_00965 [Synechococcus sp. WH 5701]MCP9826203.1 hypothetical protein [Synechococcus sp. EJ6-Ellesmere]WFN59910.1 hypothetical protein N4320_04795 [Synechococcus sp. CCFWC 502]CAK6698154.1 hypothetical protein ICNINCKA_02375 [Synechococcus sp. CBW1107]